MRFILVLLCFCCIPLAFAMNCDTKDGIIICTQEISFTIGDTEQQDIIHYSTNTINDTFQENVSSSVDPLFSSKSSVIQGIIVCIGLSVLFLSAVLFFFKKK